MSKRPTKRATREGIMGQPNPDPNAIGADDGDETVPATMAQRLATVAALQPAAPPIRNPTTAPRGVIAQQATLPNQSGDPLQQQQAINATNDDDPIDALTLLARNRRNPIGPRVAGPGVAGQLESTRRVNSKRITETVSYPYLVSLPLPFRAFLESASMSYIVGGNSVIMKFADKRSLTEGIKKLKSSGDVRATTILAGIDRSI